MKKYMIVLATADREHVYFYHGKDKKGMPIFYGFLNYHKGISTYFYKYETSG